MRFFIRADANPNIGKGHVMRCLSIADALKAAEHEVKFLLADKGVANLIQDRGFPVVILNSNYKHMEAELPSWPKKSEKSIASREDADLIIVDSYFVTATYLTALHYRGKYIAYVDDLALFPYPVDILINYNAYANKRTYEKLYSSSLVKMPLLLLGHHYAPLRSIFCGVTRRTQPQSIKNILLSTGGADSLHLALNTVKMLASYDNITSFTWHILLGALNQDKRTIRTFLEGKQFEGK